MPRHDVLHVKVTLLVDVDGHTLRFEEVAEVAGMRFYGANPRDQGYAAKPADTLEALTRGAVDTGTARVWQRSTKMLQRMYPVHGDGPLTGELCGVVHQRTGAECTRPAEHRGRHSGTYPTTTPAGGVSATGIEWAAETSS